jgi:hypothetical protein
VASSHAQLIVARTPHGHALALSFASGRVDAPQESRMSNLWHRFWHPGSPEGGPSQAERDASLWTPTAIAETQREMWSHAGEALHLWWRFWSGFWPHLPALPPAGVLEPPQPPAPMPLVAPDAALPPPRRSAATAARKGAAARHGARATGAARTPSPRVTRPPRGS